MAKFIKEILKKIVFKLQKSDHFINLNLCIISGKSPMNNKYSFHSDPIHVVQKIMIYNSDNNYHLNSYCHITLTILYNCTRSFF